MAAFPAAFSFCHIQKSTTLPGISYKISEKQYKRQNEHIKENYDRISITLPKGTKERIKSKGESINGYITRLVLTDLDK